MTPTGQTTMVNGTATVGSTTTSSSANNNNQNSTAPAAAVNNSVTTNQNNTTRNGTATVTTNASSASPSPSPPATATSTGPGGLSSKHQVEYQGVKEKLRKHVEGLTKELYEQLVKKMFATLECSPDGKSLRQNKQLDMRTLRDVQSNLRGEMDQLVEDLFVPFMSQITKGSNVEPVELRDAKVKLRRCMDDIVRDLFGPFLTELNDLFKSADGVSLVDVCATMTTVPGKRVNGVSGAAKTTSASATTTSETQDTTHDPTSFLDEIDERSSFMDTIFRLQRQAKQIQSGKGAAPPNGGTEDGFKGTTLRLQCYNNGCTAVTHDWLEMAKHLKEHHGYLGTSNGADTDADESSVMMLDASNITLLDCRGNPLRYVHISERLQKWKELKAPNARREFLEEMSKYGYDFDDDVKYDEVDEEEVVDGDQKNPEEESGEVVTENKTVLEGSSPDDEPVSVTEKTSPEDETSNEGENAEVKSDGSHVTSPQKDESIDAKQRATTDEVTAIATDDSTTLTTTSAVPTTESTTTPTSTHHDSAPPTATAATPITTCDKATQANVEPASIKCTEDGCDTVIKTLDDLNRHMLEHNIFPHTCHICNDDLDMNLYGQLLYSHDWDSHRIFGGEFSCLCCNLHFRNHNLYTEHIHIVHLNSGTVSTYELSTCLSYITGVH